MTWKSRHFLLLLVLAGCGENGIEHGMENQPKLKPLRESTFFSDGRASRMPVEGTVPVGHLKTKDVFFTGKVNGQDTDSIPLDVDRALLMRGRERYDIFCAACHGTTGAGNGIIVQRGFPKPPSFHSDRLRQAKVGHFFDVMTNGFGVMYSYNDKLTEKDRWAVAAYIRALQKSQNTPANNLNASDLRALDAAEKFSHE